MTIRTSDPNTVHTRGKLVHVPNQPKTTIRGMRISDDLWNRAKAKAADEGTDVSTVVRALLEDWVEPVALTQLNVASPTSGPVGPRSRPRK
jgi:hypothetical protein